MLDGLPLDLGRAHVNRGNCSSSSSTTMRAALADFEQAAGVVGRRGRRPRGRPWRGTTSATPGSSPATWSGALATWTRPRVVLAPLSPVAEATCDQDRAEVLMAAGLVAEGGDRPGERRPGLRHARLRRRQGEAELSHARALVARRPAAAARIAARRPRDGSSATEPSRGGCGPRRSGPWPWPSWPRPVLPTWPGPRSWSPRAAGRASWRRPPSRCSSRSYSCRSGAGELRRGAVGAGRGPGRALGAAAGPAAAPDRDVRAELAVRGRARRGGAPGTSARGLEDAARLAELVRQPGPADQRRGPRGPSGGARASRWRWSRARTAVLFEWSERARMLASRIQPVRAAAGPEDRGRPGRAARRAGTRARGRAAPAGPRARVAAPRVWRGGRPGRPGRAQARLGADTALVAYVVTRRPGGRAGRH